MVLATSTEKLAVPRASSTAFHLPSSHILRDILGYTFDFPSIKTKNQRFIPLSITSLVVHCSHVQVRKQVRVLFMAHLSS